jgi:nitrate reductase / nitrite oxidoreductase, alpha subunit
MQRFTSLGPLMDTLGNGGKGINWNTTDEVDFLKQLNYTKPDGAAAGRPKIETAIDAAEVILSLAPETNGQVAVKAWAGAKQYYGSRPYTSGTEQGRRENSLPRYSGAAAQNHLQPNMVRLGRRTCVLQRLLHQRSRADPLAYAEWPPAAVSGS